MIYQLHPLMLVFDYLHNHLPSLLLAHHLFLVMFHCSYVVEYSESAIIVHTSIYVARWWCVPWACSLLPEDYSDCISRLSGTLTEPAKMTCLLWALFEIICTACAPCYILWSYFINMQESVSVFRSTDWEYCIEYSHHNLSQTMLHP